MSAISSYAKVTESTAAKAGILDSSSRGLEVRHLRAFLEQVDLLELGEEVKVRVEDKPHASSSYRMVEISAEVVKSDTHTILPPDSDCVDGQSAPNVHTHGAEDGPGFACRERLVGGLLLGACTLAKESSDSDTAWDFPAVSGEELVRLQEIDHKLAEAEGARG